MSYPIQEHTKEGITIREATNEELLKWAREEGDLRAVKVLMKRKGLKWKDLTIEQKMKIFGVLLGEEDV